MIGHGGTDQCETVVPSRCAAKGHHPGGIGIVDQRQPAAAGAAAGGIARQGLRPRLPAKEIVAVGWQLARTYRCAMGVYQRKADERILVSVVAGEELAKRSSKFACLQIKARR